MRSNIRNRPNPLVRWLDRLFPKSCRALVWHALGAGAIACLLYPSAAKSDSRPWIVGQQAPSQAFMQQCMSRLAPTRIHVGSMDEGVRYHHSFTVNALTSRASHASRAGNANRFSRVLGLTESAHSFSAEVQSNLLIDPKSGMACARPQIKIIIKTKVQDIFVGAEFPKGSCAYQEILNHELRHAQVNRTVAQQVAGLARPQIERYFGQRIVYGPQAQLEREVMGAVEGQWFDWLKNQMSRTDELHAQIDMPHEYQRMTHACNGEVGKRLRGQ